MDASLYFAPTYFPLSYFYQATPPATSPSDPLYFAPTYFPLSYFYGASPASVVVIPIEPVIEPTGRDSSAYAALLSLVKATGVFEEVIYGAATQRSQAGADGYPLAVVTPRGWEESDDFDPALIVRRVSFSINVVVKSQDVSAQFEELDRLSTAIQKVVDRSDLDGSSLAPLTRIRAGRYDYTMHYPEQSVSLEGEFSSLIDPLANASASS